MYFTASVVFHTAVLVFAVDAFQEQPTKSDLVEVAQLAEFIRRFSELKVYINKVIDWEGIKQGEEEVTLSELLLLISSYNGPLKIHREVWNALSSKDGQTRSEETKRIVASYKTQVENEMENMCNEALNTIEKLSSGVKDDAVGVVAVTFKADIVRYQVLYSTGDIRKSKRDEAENLYKALLQASTDVKEKMDVKLLRIAEGLADLYNEVHEFDKAIDLLTRTINNANKYKESNFFTEEQEWYLLSLNKYLRIVQYNKDHVKE